MHVVQRYDEGMVKFHQDLFFRFDVFHLFLLDNIDFLHDLQGIHFLAALQLDKLYSTKRPVAQRCYYFEIVDMYVSQVSTHNVIIINLQSLLREGEVGLFVLVVVEFCNKIDLLDFFEALSHCWLLQILKPFMNWYGTCLS